MKADAGIARHRDEVLRWNRQVNLVSRVDPHRRVDALVRECRMAWTLLKADGIGDGSPEATAWIDLGSGAGFPGLVWAIEREYGARSGDPGDGLLVEPREKRAWFLNRCLRMLDLERTSVLAAGWGAGPTALQRFAPREAVVSLKAIRMADDEILGGLASAGGSSLVVATIVRFVSRAPGARGASECEAPGTHGRWTAEGQRILDGDDVRLAVTRFRRT